MKLLRSDRPTVAMVLSGVAHVVVIGVLLWRVAPSTTLAAKMVADVAMSAPAMEQLAEATPTETVTATAPPEAKTQETQVVEAEAAKPDEVTSVEPLPELVETSAPEAVVALPPPKPRPVRTTAAPQPPAPKPEPVQAESQPQQAAAVPESSGAPAAVQTADAARAVSAGPPPSYLSTLSAWLERYKQYPRMAQLRRQEGTALLRFRMTRDGHVVSHRLERSSGHTVLDREVEDLIERASPLPAMPADMVQEVLEVVVPIAFGLRH